MGIGTQKITMGRSEISKKSMRKCEKKIDEDKQLTHLWSHIQKIVKKENGGKEPTQQQLYQHFESMDKHEIEKVVDEYLMDYEKNRLQYALVERQRERERKLASRRR